MVNVLGVKYTGDVVYYWLMDTVLTTRRGIAMRVMKTMHLKL